MRRFEPRVMQISVPSEFGYEKVAMYSARVLAERTGLAEERIQDLETAVSEACLNAIEHAHRQRPGIKLVVSFRASREELQVTVIDRGAGDIPRAHRPHIAEKVEGREASRGWGMFLIEELVDQVKTTVRRGGGKNIRLIVRLESKKHPAAASEGELLE